MSRPLDPPAVRAGTLIALLTAVPVAVVGQLLDADTKADQGEDWVVVFPLLVMAGLALGAAVAAYAQRKGTPLAHGLVVALGVFVLVQAIGVVRRLVSGEDVTWSRVLSSAFLAAIAGLLGGIVGSKVANTVPPRRGRAQL